MNDQRRTIEADLDAFEADEAWPDNVGVTDAAEEPAPIPDQRAAAGVMRRVRRLYAERAELEDTAQGQIDRIERWRDDRVSGIEREISWGERALDVFARRMLLGKKKRSVPLPDGTLKLRAPSERCVVTDPAAFAEWAYTIDEETGAVTLHHPETVRVKVEPALDSIKKNAERSPSFVTGEAEVGQAVSLHGGELIPGIEIRRGTADSFGIDLAAE
jgi:hypothetical protein